MATRKKNSSAPTAKADDLTQSKIPGGIARWFTKPTELTPRRSREIDAYNMIILPKLRRLTRDEEFTKSDNPLDQMPTGISLEDARNILDMNTVAAWVYLRSWTLKNNGEPVPLPTSLDDVLDLPTDLSNALVEHAGKILADQVSEDPSESFEPDGIQDEDSPTTV